MTDALTDPNFRVQPPMIGEFVQIDWREGRDKEIGMIIAIEGEKNEAEITVAYLMDSIIRISWLELKIGDIRRIEPTGMLYLDRLLMAWLDFIRAPSESILRQAAKDGLLENAPKIGPKVNLLAELFERAKNSPDQLK